MKGTGLFMKELLSKDIKELVALRKQLRNELFELKMKNKGSARIVLNMGINIVFWIKYDINSVIANEVNP